MTLILTLALMAVFAAVIGVRFVLANRRAARQAALDERRARERAAKEKEILDRLAKMKKKDDLSAASSAARKDPERAARVVGRMMRRKD